MNFQNVVFTGREMRLRLDQSLLAKLLLKFHVKRLKQFNGKLFFWITAPKTFKLEFARQNSTIPSFIVGFLLLLNTAAVRVWQS